MKIKATKVENFDHCLNPGDFFLTPPNDAEGGCRRLSFRCPCGCGDLCGIKIRNDGQQQNGAWSWNQNEDKPTCSPSILIGPNHWHGYLREGEFTPC